VKAWLSRAVDVALYATVGVILFNVVTRRSSGPSEGATAAAFDLPVVGEPARRFSLESQHGKPVLIEVFASWCSACQRTAPMLANVFQNRTNKDVTFVGVSVDGSLEEAARVKTDWHIPYDVALDDGRMSKDYKIEVLPTLVFVDRSGRVRHVTTGVPSASTIESWLNEP
jgi:cytochrome c biogenesis protein CcmG/thiol:disulfide interchange protein DsbE